MTVVDAASPEVTSETDPTHQLAGDAVRRDPVVVRSLVKALALTGAGGFVLLASLTRQAGIPAWRSIWAEDAVEFLGPAYVDPSPARWLDPYAGYQQLIPRIAASLISLAPPEAASRLLALSSAVLATGCVLLFVVGLGRTVLPGVASQVALVVAIGSVDTLPLEAAANLANVHWFVTLGLIGLVLLPSRGWGAAAVFIGGIVLGLTDFYVIPIAGLAALWAVVDLARRAPRRHLHLPAVLGVAVGGAGQLLTTVVWRRPPSGQPAMPLGESLELYGSAVLIRGIAATAIPPLLVLVGLAAIVALSIFLATVMRGPRLLTRLTAAGALLIGSVASWVLSTTLSGAWSERYALVPVVFIITAVAVLLAGTGPRAGPACVGLLAVMLAAQALLGWHEWYTWRSPGPDYDVGIEQARQHCALGSEPVGKIVVSPLTSAVWLLDVPCDRFR